MKKNLFKLKKEKIETNYFLLNQVDGYIVHPKNKVNFSKISIKEMIIFNRDFIDKILRKKIQKKLEYYMRILISTIEEEDEDATRIALDDLERFKDIILTKYKKFLKENYYKLLIKKLNNLYRKMREKQLVMNQNELNFITEQKKSK